MNDEEKQNTGVRSQKSEYKAETTLTDSLVFYFSSLFLASALSFWLLAPGFCLLLFFIIPRSSLAFPRSSQLGCGGRVASRLQFSVEEGIDDAVPLVAED
jgi:hypothetical protein